MRIALVGCGYVGLVTGTCFAESGHHVTCMDVDEGKIGVLRGGEVPIYEPGLDELVRRNVKEGRLGFTTSLEEAMEEVDVVFITVGAPIGEIGDADLTYVLAAAEQIGRHVERYTLIVNKSTAPVGTVEKVAEVVGKSAQAEFDVVSNPEFLKEGAALQDFMRPDRVVVGASSERARARMAELYAPFLRAEQPILFMDPRSAELIKYAANAMLATRISFMNEMAALCERVGADVDSVRRGLGADRRIGQSFLFPGVGFGGRGSPKDIRALMTMARRVGLDFDLLRAVERTNDRQKRLLFDVALKQLGTLAGKRVGVWGLAYKPRTDDMREAPSLVLIQLLVGAGAEVQAHDPVAGEAAARLVGGPRVRIVKAPYDAAEAADALFLVTEWNEFRNPDYGRLARLMRGRALFDGRNVWDPEKARAAGFQYYGVGRACRGIAHTPKA
jgi:UDPglucose 6-dehydrogenase